jgi:histone acetyltransferase
MADEEKPPPVNDVQIQGKQPPTQGTTGEMSRPNNLQRIAQKKAMVKNYSRTKKLEKLAVYSSCKVYVL